MSRLFGVLFKKPILAFLDAVAVGLRNIDHVRIAELPRMADFSKLVVACEPALPWPTCGFLAASTGTRAEAVALELESDPVAVAVRRLVEERGSWEGTASELLEVLEPYVPDNTIKT